MSKDQLFIPDKIRVGYQKRGDTYTKKLAYIIYYDAQGKLRKETSWQSWRHKDIEPEDFDNKPHSGFVINKDVQRSSEWYGSGRNMIRVYDDRGMEFEITCDNLINILMTTDCLRRGLEGEFVYAWEGKELILLPVKTPEYENSLQYSQLQGQKVSAKTLKPGCVYKTKKEGKLIYLGKFDWYELTNKYLDTTVTVEKKTRPYVFITENKRLENLASLTSLAVEVSDVPVDNFAELMQVFTESQHSNKITRFVSESATIQFQEITEKDRKERSSYQMGRKNLERAFVKLSDTRYQEYSIYRHIILGNNDRNNPDNIPSCEVVGYDLHLEYDHIIDENGYKKVHHRGSRYYNWYDTIHNNQYRPYSSYNKIQNKKTWEELQELNFVKVFAERDDGTKIKLGY